MSSITFIGIGNMGAALATTILDANSSSGGNDNKSDSNRDPLAVTLWNRTASRPQVLAAIQAGGRFEPDIASAVAASDLVVICLLDYNTLYRAFEPMVQAADAAKSSTLFAGKTIVNLTNGTPRQAAAATSWFKSRGASRYFDGAVMVTPQLVGTPHAFVIYSGETEAAFSSTATTPSGSEPREGPARLLKPLGHTLYVGQDTDTAATYDLAALAAMYGMFSGAFIGMGLLQKRRGGTRAKDGQNKDTGKTLPGVEKVVIPLLTALVPYVGLLAKSMDEETWDDNMGSPLGMQLEGLRNILRACKEEGVDGTGLEFLAATMERAMADRGEDSGVAVVGTYLLK